MVDEPTVRSLQAHWHDGWNAGDVGADAVVLTYTVHLPDGTHKQGADTMRVDGEGRVVECRSHYHAFGPKDVEGLLEH